MSLSMATAEQFRSIPCNEIEILNGEEGELGSGSFGVVRLARHHSIGLVALKCFPVTGSRRQKVLLEKKLKKEMEAIQKANHQNIIRVHGWTKWQNAMAIVAELMPNGNLRDVFMDEDANLPIPLRLRMLTDVARGLAFIHNFSSEKRLVHGDIKPENILFDRNLQCKIADFGAAEFRSYTTTLTVSSAAASTEAQYTPAYTAPERLVSLQTPLTKEMDVYSYALVVHMALTQKNPYTLGHSALFTAVKKGERPLLDDVNKLKSTLNQQDREIVDLLVDVMKKCWKQNPKDRPTMIDVRNKLEARLSKIKPDVILHQVADAVKQIDIGDTSFSDGEFSPLNTLTLQAGLVVTHSPSERPGEVEASNQITYDELHSTPGTSQQSDQQAQRGAEVAASNPTTYDKLHSTPGTSQQSEQQVQPGADSDFIETAISGEELRATFKQHSSDLEKLLKACLQHFKMLRFGKARDQVERLLKLIRERKYSSAVELEVLAFKLRKKKHYLQSAAFYRVAASLHTNKVNTEHALEGIKRCVEGMTIVNKELAACDVSAKQAITKHVIPLMRDVRHEVQKVRNVDGDASCVYEAWCLHLIGMSQYYIKEWKHWEVTLQETIALMENRLGTDSAKYKVYCYFLHNIGIAYENMSKYELAATYYKKAIERYKKCSEYTDEDERQQYIEFSESVLRGVQNKLL